MFKKLINKIDFFVSERNFFYNVFNLIFLLCLSFYLFRSFCQFGSLLHIYTDVTLYWIMYYFLIFICLYKMFVMFIDKNFFLFFFSILIIFVFYISYYLHPTHRNIFESALFIISCYKIGYRKIIFCFVFSIGTIIFSETILSLCGIIQDLIYINSKGEYRHSFGGVYPTDYAASILFLCFGVWLLINKASTFFSIAILSLLIYFQFKFTITRNTEIVMIFAIMSLCIYEFLNKFNIQSKSILLLGIFSFVFFTILMVSLSFLYSKFNCILKLNEFLSGRLELSYNSFIKNGIYIFGNEIQMVGFGNGNGESGEYNFLDISYILILIKYGVASYAIYFFMYVILYIRAMIATNVKLLFVLILVTIHSTVEHHYIDICYNFSLLLLFSNLYCTRKLDNLSD